MVGITINEYQVQRATYHNERQGLGAQCRAVRGNFLDMPFEAATFDGAYAMEATCHAPKLEQVYSEVYRVLKPGALFMTYEWVTTPAFDAANRAHVACVDEIIIGNGLPVRGGRGGRVLAGRLPPGGLRPPPLGGVWAGRGGPIECSSCHTCFPSLTLHPHSTLAHALAPPLFRSTGHAYLEASRGGRQVGGLQAARQPGRGQRLGGRGAALVRPGSRLRGGKEIIAFSCGFECGWRVCWVRQIGARRRHLNCPLPPHAAGTCAWAATCRCSAGLAPSTAGSST